jgi:hypothetical protein
LSYFRVHCSGPLTNTTNCHPELLAIEDASASLRLLKREQVDFEM